MLELLVAAIVLLVWPSSTSSEPTRPTIVAAERAELERVLALLPSSIAPQWRELLLVIAAGESSFRRLVGRGSTSGAPPTVKIYSDTRESDAALSAYTRNRAWFVGAPWPRNRYTWGSGGWFALIWGYAAAALPLGERAKASPWSIFDPVVAVVLALAQLQRLTRYAAFQLDPSFGRVRAGFGAPGRMAVELDAGDLDKWRQDAREAGIDPAILEDEPPELPELDWFALIQTMGGKLT